MSKMTIYDISKLAGVSITTVSRVLNGAENVNAETREMKCYTKVVTGVANEI